MKTIRQRLKLPTPRFFRKVSAWGKALIAAGTTLMPLVSFGMPAVIPAVLAAIGGTSIIVANLVTPDAEPHEQPLR
jgi:hypothetical protein